MEENTFLKQSEEVRAAYLVVLGAISTADHENTEEELAFMEQMTAVADLSEEYKSQVSNALKDTKSVDLKSQLEKLKDNELKFALVTDLLNMAYKDGDLENSEVEAIKQVNGVLGISNEQYEALLQYTKAANQEADKEDGTPDVSPEGEIKAPKAANFLDSMGLGTMFSQLGIPAGNFKSGSTVGNQLASTAFFFIQNYVKSNTQQVQGSLGDKIGGFIGSALANMQKPKPGQQPSNTGGLSQMVAGFLSSDMGKSTINNVINNVVSATSKGKGLGNLMNMIGGGQKGQTPALGNILASFMQGGQK
ncbi:MAG: TerB family tellurite resistance protein [Microscillaceae bacterium]|nr:TerB family tellurite resistance protein [Microscillaceae bacterium]